MPCFGEYLEENYACNTSCLDSELCIKKIVGSKGLAGLPEFLTHRNPKFRKVACKFVEES